MSELSDIHDKINGVAGDVREMSGMLKATLPHLVTKDQAKLIAKKATKDCKKNCSHTPKPSLFTGRNITKIVVAIAGIIAAILGTIQAIG
jgi:hypothetical protein